MRSYTIKIEQFEGPFDLILYFIERNELDIHDIPILKITEDFLEYIRQMRELDIEVASEFILVAATLMRIKAKMLIPRKELNEDGEEIDPREELVQRLLEYKRYKEVLEDIQKLESDRWEMIQRGNTVRDARKIADVFSTDFEMEQLDMFKLMNVFKKVMTRFEKESTEIKHEVIRYNYTVQEQKDFLNKIITTKEKVPFENIFDDCENSVHCIFRFLTILEMVQEQLMSIVVGVGKNNFWLSSYKGDEPEPAVG